MGPTVGYSKRLTELDGMRALSIVPVLALHASYGRILPGGFLGVDMFFVLSGYIITRLLTLEQHATDRVDLGAFYIRRAFRILPPLFLCLAIALPLRGDPPDDRLFVGAAVLGFFANFIPAETLGNLGPLWSLAIEEQFYLVWPLVFILTFKGAPRLTVTFALAVIATAMLTRIGLANLGWPYSSIYAFTFARMDSIMIGCVLALLEPRLPQISGKTASAFGYAGVLAISLCLIFAQRDYMSTSAWAFTLFEIVVAVLIFSLPRLDQKSLLNAAFTNRVAVYIGQRSYGIYLYHYPIFKACEYFRVPGSVTNFLMVLVLETAIAFAVAELSWRYVEQPALQAKKRFMANRRAQSPA